MISRNAVRCKLCGDVIESTYRHDFKWCKCGNCAVDGGKSYLKRCFKTSPDNLEELSVSLEIYEYNGEDLYKEHYLPDWMMDALYTDKSIYYDCDPDPYVNDRIVSAGDYIVLEKDESIRVYNRQELDAKINDLLNMEVIDEVS